MATMIVVILAGSLALTGTWQKIWPIFGASNQLVAALALLVISCWLLSHKKTLKFTILPAVFMFITTLGALVFQLTQCYLTKDYLLLGISIVLMALAFYLLVEAIKVLAGKRGKGG